MRIPTQLGPLAVESVGASGGPTAILWHSLFCDGKSWDPVLPLLAPGRRLLVVDGPGHGDSPGAGRTFTLDECADAAEAILDHEGLAEVDWIGNAWGGHVGVVLAARGRRVRKLAVIASPMQPLGTGARLKATPLVSLFRLVGARDFLVGAVAGAMLLPERRRALRPYLAAALRRPPRRALALAMRSAMLERPSLVERLPSIRCPTLFVATEDDPTWPVPIAREQAALLPDGRFVTMTGSCHLPPLEAPETLARLLLDFL